MIIQINTDSSIKGQESPDERVKTMVEKALGRFSERLTRIEVHLHDENMHKAGQNDKRCTIEARAAGLQPIAVTEHADTISQAVSGACEKMKSALQTTFGKQAKF